MVLVIFFRKCGFFPVDNLPVDTNKDTAMWISDALGSSEKMSSVP